MKYLTRDMILGQSDLKTEDVNIPEWGGTVTVKAMTGKERDMFEASLSVSGKVNLENIRAKLVALTLIDKKTGAQLFSFADIEALGNKSAAGLDRAFTVSQRLSKITEKDVDELVKN